MPHLGAARGEGTRHPEENPFLALEECGHIHLGAGVPLVHLHTGQLVSDLRAQGVRAGGGLAKSPCPSQAYARPQQGLCPTPPTQGEGLPQLWNSTWELVPLAPATTPPPLPQCQQGVTRTDADGGLKQLTNEGGGSLPSHPASLLP